MLHTKFRPTGSREKNIEGFLPYMGRRPSWSYDLDAAAKLSFPLPMEVPHKIWLDWPSGLGEENV